MISRSRDQVHGSKRRGILLSVVLGSIDWECVSSRYKGPGLVWAPSPN